MVFIEYMKKQRISLLALIISIVALGIACNTYIKGQSELAIKKTSVDFYELKARIYDFYISEERWPSKGELNFDSDFVYHAELKPENGDVLAGAVIIDGEGHLLSVIDCPPATDSINNKLLITEE